jgi:hypothetical protein
LVEAHWQGVVALYLAWLEQGEEWLPLQGKLLLHDEYLDRSNPC